MVICEHGIIANADLAADLVAEPIRTMEDQTLNPGGAIGGREIRFPQSHFGVLAKSASRKGVSLNR